MPLIHSFDLATEEVIKSVKLRILSFCNAKNIDSSHVVAAMADVLGMIAAKLDNEQGVRQTLDDRMDSFYYRAKQSYARHRMASMPHQKKVG